MGLGLLGHGPNNTEREVAMANDNDRELDFIGNFSLLAGAIWILGAAALVTMVVLGHSRV
jgi:hypothetical protein